MKDLKKIALKTLFVLTFVFVGCSGDDNDPIVAVDPVDETPTEVNSKTYPIGSVSNPDISGTAEFIELSDASVKIELKLNNTPSGGSHPAHIHVNTAVEGGAISISLEAVDGSTGESITIVTALDDGTAVTYAQLLEFDGYINVHLSADDLATLVAQGDVGQNELNGTSKEYALGSVAVADINGTATFYERNNGEALAVIQLENTPAGGEHPGHIHNNTAVEGGGIAFSFNPVNGDTGIGRTNVAALDDGTAFGYADVLGFNGYVNIHLSAMDLATLVAQGDIGQNELTGKTVSYDLGEAAIAGISGAAVFAERVNETTLVTIELMGTPAGGMHPAHIHENDIATMGGIIVGLNAINGDTGISKTQISEFVGGETVTYTELLSVDAYINIHLSDMDLATLVAQGNIGSNVGTTPDTNGGTESKTYAVTNMGATAYVFNGEGLSDESNPDFTFKRGSTYTFNVNTPGHPFLINSVQGTGTGNQFNEGVTNNGAVSGAITFTVPMNAPDTLYYNCEFHSSMTGMITVTN